MAWFVAYHRVLFRRSQCAQAHTAPLSLKIRLECTQKVAEHLVHWVQPFPYYEVVLFVFDSLNFHDAKHCVLYYQRII